tara:strand:- start:2979 stop:3119 length:141 start_codon:yes stop_codon:yes gene_type:complete
MSRLSKLILFEEAGYQNRGSVRFVDYPFREWIAASCSCADMLAGTT